MSRFIESIRLEDGQIFLAELHQQRIDGTLRHFGSSAKINITEILQSVQTEQHGLFKLRIVYDLKDVVDVKIILYVPQKHTEFQLVENNTINYNFKSENREEFQQMKKAASGEEIIVVQNNHLTDTSYSNLIFYKNKQVFTPDAYLLNGVQRQHLLRAGKINTTAVTLDNFTDFSHFQLINAMNRFGEGARYPISAIRDLL